MGKLEGKIALVTASPKVFRQNKDSVCRLLNTLPLLAVASWGGKLSRCQAMP
jgi:hypothetical protein